MIALIDYGMGNLSSVSKAFKAVGAKDMVITSYANDIKKADAIVLPGVGNFGDGMRNLKEFNLDAAIKASVEEENKPFFGICLGMQLLMEGSEEAPGVPGLGLLKGQTVRFENLAGLKIPQIGWNSVNLKYHHPYFSELESDEYFYFVHSFYLKPENSECILGETNYGINFCSCVAKDNIFATQFHPEKSQDAGLTILKNFVKSL